MGYVAFFDGFLMIFAQKLIKNSEFYLRFFSTKIFMFFDDFLA
jgi:hypothetical protein